MELPEEMRIEILLRLPVKSLVRFRLVCKTWNHILKSPSFISMHHKFNSGIVSQLLMCSAAHQDNINDHVFSFRSNDNSATVLSPDIGIPAKAEVLVHLAADSCNGIVCYHDKFSIFLSNPTTREFKQLPPTSFPMRTLSGFAFGFDSTNIYDFKVLCLFATPDRMSFNPEIFTLSSNTWNQLRWGLDRNGVQCFSRHAGLFFASSFHFPVYHHKSKVKDIVCCDIHTERFRTMELPSHKKGSGIDLMVFKKFLSAVCTFPPLNSEKAWTDIWIMKDYGVVESWTKLYSIRPPWGDARPQCFWTVKDALLVGIEKNKLVSYRLDTQSFESIEIHGCTLYSHIIVHQETLVSIM